MPGMSWTVAFGLAAPLLCAVALANAPLQDSGDIIVTGERPHIEAGLWHFTLWPSHGVIGAAGERRTQVMGRSHQADACIPDAEFDVTVKRLLGDSAEGDLMTGCSAVHVRIAGEKLRASTACSRLIPGTTIRSDLFRTYSGRLRSTALDVRTTTRFEIDGEPTGDMYGKLTARRVGECASAKPSAKDIPPPERRTPPLAEPARTEPLPAAPEIPSISAPAVDAQPDDIVVIARKLRTIRLHFASDGRQFSWCHADVSSGDPRLDRIGCAIVRTCVEQGYDEQDTALACFNRKVATLEEPPTPKTGSPTAAPLPPPSAASPHR